MNRSKFSVIVVAFFAELTVLASAQQSRPAVLEQGKFILHKFEQPIGEETYQIARRTIRWSRKSILSSPTAVLQFR
jgi:hypothetical protein